MTSFDHVGKFEDALRNNETICLQQIIYAGDFIQCLGCDCANKFGLYTGDPDANNRGIYPEGQMIGYCQEESSILCRIFCPPSTPFDMTVKDKQNGNLLMKIIRPFKCTDTKSCISCWTCPCIDCGQELSIEDHQGNKIGTIKEDAWNTCMKGGFTAYDDKNTPILSVAESCCWVCWSQTTCVDTTFQIKDLDGQGGGDFGEMRRKWKCKGCVLDVDDFKVVFKKTASVNVKKIAVALMVFVKYVWFENEDDGGGG